MYNVHWYFYVAWVFLTINLGRHLYYVRLMSLRPGLTPQQELQAVLFELFTAILWPLQLIAQFVLWVVIRYTYGDGFLRGLGVSHE
jgi:hypothetical protein